MVYHIISIHLRQAEVLRLHTPGDADGGEAPRLPPRVRQGYRKGTNWVGTDGVTANFM